MNKLKEALDHFNSNNGVMCESGWKEIEFQQYTHEDFAGIVINYSSWHSCYYAFNWFGNVGEPGEARLYPNLELYDY